MRITSKISGGSRMKRIGKIIEILKTAYPGATTALNFGSVFQLLVAVILSAQCTDERVNKVTSLLFDKFGTAEKMAVADLAEIEKIIFSTGFYKNKAKNIKASAVRIVDVFGGHVPANMADLLSLPGVARKTANVVLSNFFNIQEGIVVDTHVMRLSGRLRLVAKILAKQKNALKIEQQLIKSIPRADWGLFPHLLILHGRAICKARKPLCNECPLNKLCPSAFQF